MNFNLSLLAKLACRIHNSHNALWPQILKGPCFPKNDFLDAEEGGGAVWQIEDGKRVGLEGYVGLSFVGVHATENSFEKGSILHLNSAFCDGGEISGTPHSAA